MKLNRRQTESSAEEIIVNTFFQPPKRLLYLYEYHQMDSQNQINYVLCKLK